MVLPLKVIGIVCSQPLELLLYQSLKFLNRFKLVNFQMGLLNNKFEYLQI